ncbi:hypothetical protein, partial [Arthrobacter sp. SAFR-014]|uniref:hypothetical protein n=1 Tax=Arthrobacter sp. SAFR-014 TaxID=3387280 RepID=UPI003F7B874F
MPSQPALSASVAPARDPPGPTRHDTAGWHARATGRHGRATGGGQIPGVTAPAATRRRTEGEPVFTHTHALQYEAKPDGPD